MTKDASRRGARRAGIGLLAAVTCLSGMALPLASVGASSSQAERPLLDADRRGEDAIRALGDQLPAAAAANDLTPGEFRSALRSDRMVWADRSGRLFFVDDLEADDHDHGDGHLDEAETTTSSGIEQADFPLSDTFLLHSRPGSKRTIYLDFDGHDASGTAWDKDDGRTTVADPYDTDGDPSTFSDVERTQIQGVWKRMAEDFAPLDVDVTTEAPDHSLINRSGSSDDVYGTRLVVTPTYVYDCACGGVAYIGVFDHTTKHDYYQPAFVFTGGVGNGAKSIAEAGSHEVGHNLGLYHDGTSSSSYYKGHEDWAPIMGVGYHRPITQWSRGEYTGANNTEDDFAVMGSNGALVLADDHGNTTSTATAVSGPSATASGTITTAADVDAFTFSTTGGTVTIDATPALISPDLDIRLRLIDGTGGVLATVDPLSSASSGNDTSVGLDASLEVVLSAGDYTVLVDGVGYGDPKSTGYSDYASVGRYTLTATIPVDGVVDANSAPTAAITADTLSGPAPLTVQFGSDSSDPEGDNLSHLWSFGDGTSSTDVAPSHQFVDAGSYAVTLTVTDPSGASDTAETTVSATAPTSTDEAPAAPSGAAASVSGSTVTVTWTDNSGNETGFEVVRETWHSKSRSWKHATLVATTASDVISIADTPGAGTFRYRIRAVNGVGASAESVSASVTVSGTTNGGGKPTKSGKSGPSKAF